MPNRQKCYAWICSAKSRRHATFHYINPYHHPWVKSYEIWIHLGNFLFFCYNKQVIFLTSHWKTITINSYMVCDFLIALNVGHVVITVGELGTPLFTYFIMKNNIWYRSVKRSRSMIQHVFIEINSLAQTVCDTHWIYSCYTDIFLFSMG